MLLSRYVPILGMSYLLKEAPVNEIGPAFSGMGRRELRIMSGEDSGSHGKYARPVLLELPSVVGNHGQNFFICWRLSRASPAITVAALPGGQ